MSWTALLMLRWHAETPNGSWNMAITKGSKHPDEAWKFVNWVTGVEGAKMWYQENAEVKRRWEEAWPFLNERDYGFMMENYGHGGRTSPVRDPMGEFTIFDWGNGAAAEGYLRMRERFGEALLLGKS